MVKSKLHFCRVTSLLALTSVLGLLYSSNVNATNNSKFSPEEYKTLEEVVKDFGLYLNSYESYEEVFQDFYFPDRTIEDIISVCQSIQRNIRASQRNCRAYDENSEVAGERPTERFADLANIMKQNGWSYDIGLNLNFRNKQK